MIYTRYLYDKRCVKFSFLISLLQKEKDAALFWGFELARSGFSKELVTLLWSHYYDLYAPLNMNLESYLLKCSKSWIINKRDENAIANMINNLCLRDPWLDLYFIHRNAIEPQDCFVDLFRKVDNGNSKEEIDTLIDDYVIRKNLFKTRGKPLLKRTREVFNDIDFLDLEIYKKALKSRVLSGALLLNGNTKYDRKFYVELEKIDIKKYHTKPLVELKSWKIPKRECIYTVYLKPNTISKDISHYDNWLYYASKSPIWKNRIQKYKGRINEGSCEIVFDNEDNEEKFYNIYNYEPDEQSKEVQNKWFGTDKYDSWDHIYEEFKSQLYHDLSSKIKN